MDLVFIFFKPNILRANHFCTLITGLRHTTRTLALINSDTDVILNQTIDTFNYKNELMIKINQ